MTATAHPDPALEWAQAWMANHPDTSHTDLRAAVVAAYGKDAADRVTPAVWWRATPATLGTPDTTCPDQPVQPPIGATETTQPDPQVVAWLREYMHEHRDTDAPVALLAYMHRHGAGAEGHHREVLLASARAARKPQTVADIPAGQGPASLFIAPTPRGIPGLWWRRSDGGVTYITDQKLVHDALWDHLAATLPTVTDDEETP